MTKPAVQYRLVGHPLANGSLVKKVSSLCLARPEMDRLITRIAKIMDEYDQSWNAVIDVVRVRSDEMKNTMTERCEALESEYTALSKMVAEDYNRVVAPAQAYVATVAAERKTVIKELESAWNEVMNRHVQCARDASAEIDKQLDRFHADLFKAAKSAINEAVAEARVSAHGARS